MTRKTKVPNLITHLSHSIWLDSWVLQEPKPPWQDEHIQRIVPQGQRILSGAGGVTPGSPTAPYPPLSQDRAHSRPPVFPFVECCAWACPAASSVQMSANTMLEIHSSETGSKWANLCIYCDGWTGGCKGRDPQTWALAQGLAHSRHPDILAVI